MKQWLVMVSLYYHNSKVEETINYIYVAHCYLWVNKEEQEV